MTSVYRSFSGNKNASSSGNLGLGLLLVTSLVEGYGGRVPGDHKKGARLVVVLQAVEAGRRSNGDAHRRESE